MIFKVFDRKKRARLNTFDKVVRETDSALSQYWPRVCGIIDNRQATDRCPDAGRHV